MDANKECLDALNDLDSFKKIEKTFCRRYAPCNHCPAYQPTIVNEGDFCCMFNIMRLRILHRLKGDDE